MKPIRYWDKKTDIVVSLQGGDRYPVPLYAIPEGYKLVPIEPTELQIFMFDSHSSIKESIKAAIEAAPDIEDINCN